MNTVHCDNCGNEIDVNALDHLKEHISTLSDAEVSELVSLALDEQDKRNLRGIENL